jgi:hypothetical protein
MQERAFQKNDDQQQDCKYAQEKLCTGSSKNEASQLRPGYAKETWTKSQADFSNQWSQMSLEILQANLNDGLNQVYKRLSHFYLLVHASIIHTALIMKADMAPNPTSEFMFGDFRMKALNPSVSKSAEPQRKSVDQIGDKCIEILLDTQFM